MKLTAQYLQYFCSLFFFPKRRTHFFRLVIFFTLTVGIWLSLGSGQAFADTGNSLEKVSLQLKWYHQFQFAGYYAAKSQGFYQEEGLDVTIIEGGPPNPSPLESVLSGHAQYGVLDGELLNARLRGEPVVLLAVIFQHSPNVLMSRKDSGITKPSDFIGRTIMYTKGHSEIEFKSLFIYEGVPLDKIKFVPHTGSIDSIIDRRVDADTAYLTNEPYMMLKRGVEPALLKPINYGIDFYGDSLFTTEDEIRLHPERVAAFRRASLKGWEYALDNIDEMIDLIMAFPSVSVHNFSADQFQFEAEKMKELIQPKLIEIGHVNPLRWKHMADTLVHLKLFEPDYSLDGFIYDPNPKPDYTQLRLIIGIITSILLFVGICAILLLFFNRRLAREVVERKQAEDALKSAHDGLELKVDERTAELRKEMAQRKQVSEQLHKTEWLLKKNINSDHEKDQYTPPYGNLVDLNTNRVLLDSVGQEMLNSIAGDFLDLLDTSSAVYEKNGDYALGIFSSGWCRLLDNASRNLCATDNNREALNSGMWLCHESCWTEASKAAIETGQPTDIECHGGIRLYALPIRSGQEIVGAINVAYGSLPTDKQKLQEIAEKYHVQVEELLKQIEIYEERPQYIQEIAKKRLHSAARLIGEIVERKQAEKKLLKTQDELELRVESRTIELRRSKEEWEKTFDAMPEIITIQDIDMHIVHANKATHQFLQAGRGELNGKHCYKVFTGGSAPCSGCPLVATLKDREEHSAIITYKNLGKIFHVSSTIVLAENGSIQHIVHVAKDITEEKKQEQLVLKINLQQEQLKRIESLRTMAGAIAHRFNNSMMAVQGNLELMTCALPADSNEYKMASDALRAASGASQIGSMMLSYVGQQPLKLQEIPLETVAGESLASIEKLLRPSISLQFTPPDKPLYCSIDQKQIKEVIESILTNAIEAFGDGTGTIKITFGTDSFTTDSFPVAFQNGSIKDGIYSFCQIKDTGHGIEPHNLSRIFEPFFTTRFVGRGLGLALTVGIMQSHHGAITIESVPGQGTTVRVLLPSISPTQQMIASDDFQGGAVKLSGNILIADDDEMVLGVGRKMLELLGFTVHTAMDGQEAVEKISRNDIDFCAIVLDISMPEMDGIEAMNTIRGINPTLPILLSSGYSEDDLSLKKGEGNKPDGFLGKPFELSDMRSSLEKLLS